MLPYFYVFYRILIHLIMLELDHKTMLELFHWYNKCQSSQKANPKNRTTFSHLTVYEPVLNHIVI